MGTGGIVGKGPQAAEPQAEAKIYRFAGTGDTIELIVQVVWRAMKIYNRQVNNA